MSLANYIDFTLMYYNGSTWTDSYNSVQLRDITNNGNLPSGTSKLSKDPAVGRARINMVGGKKIEVDSGGFWYRFSFDLWAKNANGESVLYGLLDKTQSKNATNSYFRIYPDIVNNSSDYYDVLFSTFEEIYSIENAVRGGRFTFESLTKETTRKQI